MKKNRNQNWSKSEVLLEAKKYNYRTDFKKGSLSAYRAAIKLSCLPEVCKHMDYKQFPAGYWTKKRCRELALKYKTIKDFRKNESKAYGAAHRAGWLDNICSHMETIIHGSGYWTKDRCKERANEYTTLKEFRENEKSAYVVICQRGWNEELLSHLKRGMKAPRYWTKEKLIKKAKQYKTRAAWSRNDSASYCAAEKRGLINELFKDHINEGYQIKPPGYWTKKMCEKEGKKYVSRSEFQKANPSAYSIAQKNNWIDDICQHMLPIGTRYRRALYSFEFPDKSVYVGLTYSYKKRYSQHLEGGVVSKKLEMMGAEYIEYNQWYSAQVAQKKEAQLINKYRASGWAILNKAKPGSLGGNVVKWTRKALSNEAKKYRTKSEFARKNSSAFSTAHKQGVIEDICKHMIPGKRPNGYWTKERCRKEAKKYKSRNEFGKNSVSAYSIAKKKGWMDDICKHMSKKHSKPFGHWTKENCRKEAKKYRTRSEFEKKAKGAYAAVIKNNWMKELCGHMPIPSNRTAGYWTKERCIKEAQKYNSRQNFHLFAPGAYRACQRNGWREEVFKYLSSE